MQVCRRQKTSDRRSHRATQRAATQYNLYENVHWRREGHRTCTANFVYYVKNEIWMLKPELNPNQKSSAIFEINDQKSHSMIYTIFRVISILYLKDGIWTLVPKLRPNQIFNPLFEKKPKYLMIHPIF